MSDEAPSDDVVNGVRHVRAAYREEVRRLQVSLPSRQLKLSELPGSEGVPLLDGTFHQFEREDVERLLSEVPQYFWDFMKVPLLLYYVKTESNVSKYLVVGDRWQRRLAEIMLRGDYSSEGVSELTVDEFLAILRKYRSLVFVSLSIA